MTDFIQFGSEKIEYYVSYSDRKTLGITITPDMVVNVKAPENTSKAVIQEKVKKKAAWILKQKSFFLSFYPKTPKRKYVSGETHLYLGRQYRLMINKSENKNEVRYKGRYFEISLTKKENAGTLMQQWYRSRAKTKFPEIAEPIINRFKKYNVEPKSLHIQEMATRWGSCTPKGKIILNPEIIKAPKACIEYVIVHELCHLIHRDHTQKFLDLQSKEMPDWRRWKDRLESLLA
ncbi:SprT family zinc-dependent metalloprotease [Yeosuana marina]|uniref:M48 family metallopeptidase n=1 Tax=Yeosuana marina TaxID=1565536 RepID=UPI0030C87199